MLDAVYYYDFNAEQRIDNWQILFQDRNQFRIRTEFRHNAARKILLTAEKSILRDRKMPRINEFILNGDRLNFSECASAAYVGKNIIRRGIEIQLKQGVNILEAEGEYPFDLDLFRAYIKKIDFLDLVEVSFAEPLSRVEGVTPLQTFLPCPGCPEYPEVKPSPTLTGYTAGIGCSSSPGRFGFSQGSGYLDYAMPVLGNFDKMYLCGHPKYRKPFRWNYSTLPKGAAHHGSYRPADHGIENDLIEVNHLSCRWQADLNGIKFTCTGSLASPGVITEREDGKMRIGDLEFAGNYRYVMIPRKNGTLEISTLKDVKDLTMGKNFLLLFGCSEFPDLPLLLVFRKQPENMRLEFQPETGRLSSIEFENCPLLITATPFGFESFDPISPDDTGFLKKAADRCLFWSRALLAYPVRCEEYFQNDPVRKQTSIIQKFSYRYIRDEWNTRPLELAALPPVLSISNLADLKDSLDFHFPTKHGWLRGMIGDSASYVLPWMPVARKFPLCSDECGTKLKQKLKTGFRSYMDFVTSFPETTQSYPYAGALLEPFAWAATMFHFLDDADREELTSVLRNRLRILCDPESVYDYPEIHHGYLMETMPDDRGVLEYYQRPEMKHLRLWNWYERVEPFTKTVFHICYLNVCFFTEKKILSGSREEIRSLKIPLVENDWGLGLMFYYIYMACLASGDYEPVRRSWPLLNSAFSFFAKMHDWACMGTGYADNAVLWVEGANYGAFSSYINLAEAVGDRRAWDFGQYIASKQQALRQGILRAAQHYFCKFYDVKPWHLIKIMEEESNPSWQHMGVPDNLDDLRLREESMYNLTTEGIYPEIFESIRKFQKEEYDILLKKERESLHRRPVNESANWCQVQETASLLICMALDPDFTTEQLRSEIEFAKCQKSLLTKWRGIHIFSRRLPENYFETQLLAWDDMKQHPVWLEHWQNVRIISAELHGALAEIVFEATPGAKIRLGIRQKPARVLLNDIDIPAQINSDTVEIKPDFAGKLQLFFGEEK